MSKATKVPSHITFVTDRVPSWVYGDGLLRYTLTEIRMYHWNSRPPTLVDHGEVSGSELLQFLYGSWSSLEDETPNRFLFRSFAGRSQEPDQRKLVLEVQGGPRLLEPRIVSLVDLKSGTRVHVTISAECRGIISHVRKLMGVGAVHSVDVVK